MPITKVISSGKYYRWVQQEKNSEINLSVYSHIDIIGVFAVEAPVE